MSVSHHRLYIFTGKGGVGKTSIAMAFTKYLVNKGINAKYNCFHQNPEKNLEVALNLPISISKWKKVPKCTLAEN